MRDTQPLAIVFKQSLLAIASLAAISAYAGDQPVQSGFHGDAFKWKLTAGNLLNGEQTIDIQTNSQQGASFSDLNASQGINSIWLSTAGQTVADYSQNGELKKGHGFEVTGSVGTWKGDITFDSGAKNLDDGIKSDARTISLALKDSDITGNIVFEHAKLYTQEKDKASASAAVNSNVLDFSNIKLTGDILNRDNTFFKDENGTTAGNYYLAQLGEKRNDNIISLEDGSAWTGNLVTATTARQNTVKNSNQVL